MKVQVKALGLFLAAALLAGSCGKEPESPAGPPVYISVTSVTVSPVQATLTVGDNLSLSAQVLPYDATDSALHWSSSSPAIASVDDTGRVSALAVGIASIKVSAGGQSATCRITVEAKPISVSSISLQPGSASLEPGEELQLVATVLPAEAASLPLTWSSANKAVAQVDQDGLVQAVAEGETVIMVEADGRTATCNISVKKVEVAVTSIVINPVTLVLAPGEEKQITASVLPANATDPSVGWSSSNPAVAQVSDGGMVRALAEGEAVITARAGNCTATCSVKVSISLSGVRLDRSSVTLKIRETVQLQAFLEPENVSGIDLSWTSDAPQVASVDETGLVTAMGKGTAVIKVLAGGFSASCLITVLDDVSGSNEGIGYDED